MKQVVFDGHTFTKDEKTGYYLKTTYPRERLHRYVWEYYNGCKIPKGFDVHHIDGNKDNNDISNLTCITRKRHNQIHSDSKTWTEQQLKEARERMDHARKYASEWHKSEEGRAWHREQYEKTLGKAKQIKTKRICEYCGKTYETISTGNSRFCSNKCKSAWRRKAGLDDIEVECVFCGKKFKTNKYNPKKYCSNNCRSHIK